MLNYFLEQNFKDFFAYPVHGSILFFSLCSKNHSRLRLTASSDTAPRTAEKNFFFRFVLIIIIHSITTYAQKTIYITPGEFGQLFAINDPAVSRDDCLLPLYKMREKLRSRGLEVRQADSLKNLIDLHYLIVFDQLPKEQLSDLLSYPYEKRILFLWEPPTVKPENYKQEYHDYFSKIFTWSDDLVDNKKYFKFFYPQPRLKMIDDVAPFESKMLSVMVAKNKYSPHKNELYGKRREIILFFENLHLRDFDLYGYWWPHDQLRNYCGLVERKVDCLKWYRFCFCYENIKDLPGYVTEKIFDCFIAGCVPIYWGASNIEKYVPVNCFIDRRKFVDNKQLYEYIKKMDVHEYNEYLLHIKEYLVSQKAYFFSIDFFVSIFVNYFAA